MQFQLKVSFQYKHMGGGVDANGTMLPEVRHRAGEAGATARKLRQCVLANAALSLRSRAALGEALVGSKLRQNAQSWQPLGRGAAGVFHTACMRLYRDIASLRNTPEHQWNGKTVLVNGPFNTPEEFIAVGRLRMLPRLLKSGPECLLALLRTGDPATPLRDWVGAVAEDVGWLLRHAGDPDG